MTKKLPRNSTFATFAGGAAAVLLATFVQQPIAAAQQSDPLQDSKPAPAPSSDVAAASSSPFVQYEPRPVPPFPMLLNQAVKSYVRKFLDQPEGLKLAFERSRPFLPEMIKVMKQNGVPDDLVYLSFAESAFSNDGKGPWQFSVPTAERFGLHVNQWVDERCDPILSTRAAAGYLAQLHDQADNDWRVAVVGWNMGERYLDRYWLLEGSNYNKFANRLPRRTRQLLNRFMAVAFIAHNAAAYGIGPANHSDAPTYQMHAFRGSTYLSDIADRYDTTVSQLRALNPALKCDRLPPTEYAYPIRIPLVQNASY